MGGANAACQTCKRGYNPLMTISPYRRARRANVFRHAFSLSPFVAGMGQDANMPDPNEDPFSGITSSDVTDPTNPLTSDTSGSGATATTTPSGSGGGSSFLGTLGSTLSGIFSGVSKAATPAIVNAITGQPSTPGTAGTPRTTQPTTSPARAGAGSSSILLLAAAGIGLFLLMKKR